MRQIYSNINDGEEYIEGLRETLESIFPMYDGDWNSPIFAAYTDIGNAADLLEIQNFMKIREI